MTTPVLVQPGLYDAGAGGGLPRLRVQHCGACGHVSFPSQPYGCPRCGVHDTRIEARLLPAQGTLHASVLVNRAPRKDMPVPYVVGEVRINDGPFVRARLEVDPNQPLQNGQPMQGCLVLATNRDGQEALELRFAPTREA